MARKILLADDSITIQKVISITFASEDYELVIAGDGDTALRKARETKPDLVIADIAMPGKSGYELTAAIKSDPEFRNIPVLLLAGTFEPLDKNEAMRVGADDSIIKPFESQDLLDKVRELLASAGSSQAQAAPTAPSQSGASAAQGAQAEDIWSAGGFLSASDEFEAKTEDTGGGVDLDFLTSGGLFEEEEKGQPKAEDFTDLVINEDEFKPGIGSGPAEKGPEMVPESPFEMKGFDSGEEMKEEPPFDLGAFDSFYNADNRSTGALEIEPFGSGPKQEEAEEPANVGSFQPFREEAAQVEEISRVEDDIFEVEGEIAEPDLLEIPEEIIESRPEAPFLRKEERDVSEPPARAPQPRSTVPEAEIRALVERAAAGMEERVASSLEARLGKAEAQATEVIEKVAERVEERLRNELASKLARLDSLVAEAAERAAARMEEKIRGELVSRLQGLSVPKEQVEAIVSRSAKQVVEHVSWEVVPELAERLIKEEIRKAKEAFLKTR
ncbi:MAG: response regulator [Deltaproteobacteria bacterium]|nr:response regulator [Deltaproteobacteria bacterium]MBZ0220099.1 response regulator [Deltaproteobacteria bacterium]